ncbi:MAG TPA: hypothetical protein VID50_11765 [Candidatus Eisenbacteria bacterium]
MACPSRDFRVGSVLLFIFGVMVAESPAQGQILNARRLGMGGVTLSDQGGASANVAFRAVPRGDATGSVPLPVGLLQFASDVPTFDPGDSTFNVFEILNLAMNPPLTLKLSGPDETSGDISIYVAQDSLQIDLQDVRRVVPKSSMRSGGVYHLFGVGKTLGHVFVHAGPLVHVRNTFNLSPELRAALREAEPFTDDMRYGLSDDARAQAAVAFQAGVALRAAYAPSPDAEETTDPRRSGATALYLGAAPKILWGLAYGEARGAGGLSTGDTLFGNNASVAFDAVTRTRHAAIGSDGGSGFGLGSDVGAVLFWRRFELGLGLNDLGSQIRWKTVVREHVYVDSTNDFVTTTLARDEPFTSRIPVTTTVSAARRFGATTVAADVVDDDLCTKIHAGLEHWIGRVALRAGSYRDANRFWQYTGGAGVRVGGIGLDLAVATNSRNVEEERSTELSASLTLY